MSEDRRELDKIDDLGSMLNECRVKHDQEKLSLGLRSLNLPADRPEKKAKARKSPVKICFQDVIGLMIP